MHERSTRNRSLRVLLATLLMLTVSRNGISQMGPQDRTDVGFIETLKAQAAFRAFEQERADVSQWKQQERQRIPSYNIRLSKEIAEFHHHISDMHYCQVSCKICREHVKRIKELAKKIDQAMK